MLINYTLDMQHTSINKKKADRLILDIKQNILKEEEKLIKYEQMLLYNKDLSIEESLNVQKISIEARINILKQTLKYFEDQASVCIKNNDSTFLALAALEVKDKVSQVLNAKGCTNYERLGLKETASIKEVEGTLTEIKKRFFALKEGADNCIKEIMINNSNPKSQEIALKLLRVVTIDTQEFYALCQSINEAILHNDTNSLNHIKYNPNKANSFEEFIKGAEARYKRYYRLKQRIYNDDVIALLPIRHQPYTKPAESKIGSLLKTPQSVINAFNRNTSLPNSVAPEVQPSTSKTASNTSEFLNQFRAVEPAFVSPPPVASLNQNVAGNAWNNNTTFNIFNSNTLKNTAAPEAQPSTSKTASNTSEFLNQFPTNRADASGNSLTLNQNVTCNTELNQNVTCNTEDNAWIIDINDNFLLSPNLTQKDYQDLLNKEFSDTSPSTDVINNISPFSQNFR